MASIEGRLRRQLRQEPGYLHICVYVFYGLFKNSQGSYFWAQIPRDLVFSWHFHRGIEILKYHENIRSPVISAALMVPSGINKAPEKQTQIFEAEIEVLEYPPPPPQQPNAPAQKLPRFCDLTLGGANCATIHI